MGGTGEHRACWRVSRGGRGAHQPVQLPAKEPPQPTHGTERFTHSRTATSPDLKWDPFLAAPPPLTSSVTQGDSAYRHYGAPAQKMPHQRLRCRLPHHCQRSFPGCTSPVSCMLGSIQPPACLPSRSPAVSTAVSTGHVNSMLPHFHSLVPNSCQAETGRPSRHSRQHGT